MKSPTERFSDRVENYVKYRPSYPKGVIDTLASECGLTSDSVVADVGSGTGILTSLLLETGCKVLAVEPNDEMREAAHKVLGANKRFVSVVGKAENTTLNAGSVDLITAAQAFHWFRREETRSEFVRISKPGAWLALIWNERNTGTPFEDAYDDLLFKHVSEYNHVCHRDIGEEAIEAFFGPGGFAKAQFKNEQRFDFEDLKGRLQSSSYSPNEGDPEYAPLIDGLKTIFDEFQRSGRVIFRYNTSVYYGKLS